MLSFRFVSTNEIYTRTQLRGLYHQNMNKMFNEEIQRIVERVVAYAQGNRTSYTEIYNTPNSILAIFSNKIVINRLKNILIDSNITISGPKCCRDYKGCEQQVDEPKCTHIYINW